jgi:hypothetical protein
LTEREVLEVARTLGAQEGSRTAASSRADATRELPADGHANNSEAGPAFPDRGVYGSTGVFTYGVLSYIVAEGRREIGIRMALGAHRVNVLTEVMRQGLLLAGLGIAIGLVGAFLYAWSTNFHIDPPK